MPYPNILFKRLLLLLCLASTAAKSQPVNSVPPKSSAFTNSSLVEFKSLDMGVNGRNMVAEDKMNLEILRYRQTDSAIITLPVVFHIVNQNPSAIPDQDILDALQNLNEAFSKSGAYAASLGADTKIRFCLAKKDPDGGITNGITRTTSYFSENFNPVIEDARLKNLVQWDPSRYINIWFVKTLEQEIFPQFSCGKWLRLRGGGYATLPPNAGPLDGIVLTALKTMLVHEMGHYLGLYHTFEGLDCRNNDCSIDGDRVCDTPPDASLSSPPFCGAVTNSCSSDTLSGYTIDQNDPIANFMDYGNEACQNQFTEGQSARMRAAVATQRPGLLEDKCAPPCLEVITAAFTRNNSYPLPGSAINFTNTSTGATQYEWMVNGIVVATTQNFTYTFSNAGKTKVTLKAFNNAACFAAYTDYVIVNCGVTARFYTDKTNIASQAPTYIDTVQFINTSENGTSFTWLISSNKGMAEQVVGTSKNLSYVFSTPANYFVKLIATNGSCTDTTLVHTINVFDPTPDGAVFINSVQCVQETKIKVAFSVCNYGYASLPKGLPLTFYDGDPKLITTNKIGVTFFLPVEISGNCCGPLFTLTIDIGRKGLNSIYAVINDSGNTRPLVLPNTPFVEKYYFNNIAVFQNFAFKVTATPALSVLEPGDTLRLNAKAGPGVVSSYLWSTAKNLSCTNCPSPNLIADSSVVKRVIATSNQGCTDTGYVDIKVPPYNDYRIKINDVNCSAGDSLRVEFTIFNDFKRAVLPSTLSVSFYNGNPLTGSALLLGPIFSLPDTLNANQATFTAIIKGMNAGSLYAVINDSAKSLPVSLPNTLLTEKNYLNNTAVSLYVTEVLLILPTDTTVFRKQFVPLKINTTIYNPLSTTWSIGGRYSVSCPTCPSTMVQVFDSSIVKVQTENKYGCLLSGTARVNVFPPDMKVRIIDSKCYADNTALITFTICMNNNYDSVFANIPVSFYDGDPASGRLLQPVFYTPQLQGDSCYTYTTKVLSPATNKFYAVVNDKGQGTSPSKVYEETNYANNGAQSDYTPFTVVINPNDTTIQRLTSITLTPKATGGTISTYTWKPASFISCTTCATPVVTPQYTMKYEVQVRNENNCTASATSIVKTNTGGLIFIPDAFTPNKDQLNEVFYLLTGVEAVVVKDFSIFNRWGQKLFTAQNVAPNNPANGWNGKINGQDAAAGTYVYMITIAFSDGTQKIYKGTVVLIR
jgi:gliding motility-associated-like protein